MESYHRFPRTQPEPRQDLVVWKRVSNNLKAISNLRKDCFAIENYIKELSLQLDDGNSETLRRLSTKLEVAVKDGQAFTAELKSKVQKTKEDMSLLAKMGALGDYFSNTGELEHSSSRFNTDSQPIENVLPRQFSQNIHKKQRFNHNSANHIPTGTKVAAKIPNSKDPAQLWILANVVHYYYDKNRYLVEDVEADENDGEKHKYHLPSHHVIEIPDEKTLQYKTEFPPNHEVLALYPDTSCFYKAVVLEPPSKNRKASPVPYYVVQFDDDDNVKRAISSDMVIDMPQDY